MAISTKENHAAIVQEDRDVYFRDKMEQYIISQSPWLWWRRSDSWRWESKL